VALALFLCKNFKYKLIRGRKIHKFSLTEKVHKFWEEILDIVTNFVETHNILYFIH